MKKEVRLLWERATNSLLLSVEHFNRPWDRGRTEAVLIMLDHAFEMLLKAAILHRGGRIRGRRARQTIGFDTCVRRGLTDANVKFLSDEQALTLQTINGLRDAAQHHLVDVSEGQLYLHAQSGLTLFRDLSRSVFDHNLSDYFPTRVLPVSSEAPTSLNVLFDSEVQEVHRLLAPGRRKMIDAHAKLRGLAIMESAIAGEPAQPSRYELNKLCNRVRGGETWSDLFPGVASIDLATSGEGPTIALRFTKKEGVPIHVVPEGEGAPVAIKRVNELDYYNLGITQVAIHVGLSMPRTLSVVRRLGLQDDAEFFKEIRIQRSVHKRYSQKAIATINEALPNLDLDEVWREHGARRRG